VLKISYGGKVLLFPGDLERAGENVLLANVGDALKTDVLLAPHHGSKGSCTGEFLRAVEPELCIISSGEGTAFGFPHRQTLNRLEAVGARVIRTGKSGAVQVTVGPDRFEVSTFLGTETE
jgi:competence protein ComEC